MSLTPAQDAIEQADSYLSNAVLPTYSELLAALRAVTDAARKNDLGQFAQAWRCGVEHLDRHDRTMRGDFGA